MKRYFTKFLPVDGTPKKGDIIMSTNGVCVIWGDKSFFNIQFQNEEIIKYLKEPRVAKLMLCTQDVEVGDKVTTTKDNATFFKDVVTEIRDSGIFTDGIDTDSTGLFFTNDNKFDRQFYKVVAPISTKAKWLKEGQYLEEHEVRIMYGAPVRKTYRNGETKHVLYFAHNPSVDEIDDAAHYWAEEEGSGSQYGYTLYWDEEPTFVDHVRVLCGNCDTFH